MPSVSIVIPVFNAEQYLEACLDSVIKQTLQDIEIILVNDGSMDCSLKICQKYAEIDHRIVVCSQENQGVSAARNVGKQKAVGEYIIFIDADDRLELNMLSLMLSDAKTYEADMVICGIQKWNDIGMISQKTVSRGIEIFGKEEALRFFFRGGKFELGAWNKLIKRSVVDGIDFDINRKMNEDKFFCFEALKNSLKIIYHDENLYCYYQRNTSATYKPFDSRWFDNDYFAERIYESTKESFPQLEREARYQMLMSKYYLLLVMLRRKAGGAVPERI